MSQLSQSLDRIKKGIDAKRKNLVTLRDAIDKNSKEPNRSEEAKRKDLKLFTTISYALNSNPLLDANNFNSHATLKQLKQSFTPHFSTDGKQVFDPIKNRFVKKTDENVKKINSSVSTLLQDEIQALNVDKHIAHQSFLSLKMVSQDHNDYTTIVAPGKYIVSLKLNYTINSHDNADLHKQDSYELARELTTKKPYSRAQIADFVAKNHFRLTKSVKSRGATARKNGDDEHSISISDDGTVTIFQTYIDNISYSELSIQPFVENSYSKILMKLSQHPQYTLLGDTSVINIHPNMCVVDYIFTQFQQHLYCAALSISEIKTQLDIVKRSVLEQDFESYWAGYLATGSLHDSNSTLPADTMCAEFFEGLEQVCIEKSIEKTKFLEREGYSAEMVIEWAKNNHKQLSVHCVSPMFRRFESYKPQTRTSFSLFFLLNNNHCYPINDKDLIDKLIKTNGETVSIFGELKFSIKFDANDCYFLSKSDCQSLIESGATMEVLGTDAYGKRKSIVAVGQNSVSSIVKHSLSLHNKIDGAIQISNLGITGFKDPTTGIVFVASPDYNDVKETCFVLNEKLNNPLFQFANQSWAQLGRQLFEHLFEVPRESLYSNEYQGILTDYPVRPYNVKIYDEPPTPTFEVIDISRSYTAVIAENTDDFPVFWLDESIDFDGTLPLTVGEYFIAVPIVMGGGTIFQPAGWYPLNIVRYALERGYIALENITRKMPARFSLPADYFKKFVEFIYDTFKDNDKNYSHPACKNLINHFLGTLGIVETSTGTGVMTNSFEVACALKIDEESAHKKHDPGFSVRVDIFKEEGQIYFVKKFILHKMEEGHKPIWRHIIAGSIIRLDQLYLAVANPETVVYGYYTDSIKGINFNKIEFPEKEDRTIGCYQPEIPKFYKLYGTLFSDVLDVEHDMYKHCPYSFQPVKPWNQLDETPTNYNDVKTFVEKNSCFVAGSGGCGKTTLAKAVFDNDPEHTLVVAFTNKAVGVLSSRGVEAKTLDSYFFENKGKEPYKKLGRDGIKRVIVDEASMITMKHLSKLWRIYKLYPNIVINFFGDTNQCPAVNQKGVFVDLNNEPFIRRLLAGNLVKLCYKTNSARYDTKTYKQLEQFLQTGKMPIEWKDKKLNENLMMNVCKTTTTAKNTRDRINKQCAEKFLFDNPTVEKRKIGGVEFAVGMPVVAMENRKNKKLAIVNSKRYVIERFEEGGGVKLSDSDGAVPFDVFAVVFMHGFCDSVYRFQGDSITTPYNIYDIGMMSLNEVYTALSRCTSIDNVHFKYTEKQFERVEAPTKPKPLSIENDGVLQPFIGRIYRITFENGFNYVGQTTQTLEERLAQHKEKPVSEKMKELFIQCPTATISLLCECSCVGKELDDIEKQWIAACCSEYGERCVNVNLRDDKKNTVLKPYTMVALERDPNKYPIKEYDGYFTINYNSVEKKYRFSDKPTRRNQSTKEQARSNADSFRQSLLDPFYKL